MTCVRGLTARDRYQDRDPWFRDEAEAAALMCLETTSRPRRRDRGYIPGY